MSCWSGWHNTDAHPLIASSVLHYELEFIHPFSDGNGRIGRLWQTLILSRWQPMLAYSPVETVVKSRQEQCYRVLGDADAAVDCSRFLVLMLNAIAEALCQAIAAETPMKVPEQILKLLRERPTLTLANVAVHLGKSTSAVERAARKLREPGRLRFVGPQKKRNWGVP